MSNVNEMINGLLDHALIAVAKEAHQTTGERRARAAAEVAAARDAQKQAAAISDAAARRGEVVAATEAETNLENAERRVRVADKLHEAAGHAHKASADALTLAIKTAHAPVIIAGVRGRIAAAAKADKALATLKEAQDEMKLNDRLIAVSYAAAGASSAPNPVGSALLNAGLPVCSEQSERAIWTGKGFNDEAGTFFGFTA
jgi:hypothetical protein